MNSPMRLFCSAKTCSMRDPRLGSVRPRGPDRHWLARRLLAMEARDEAVLGHELLVGFGTVGRVRPDHACRVAFVEQPFAQEVALVGRGVSGPPGADQPEATVDAHMALVAEQGNGEISGRNLPILIGLAF